MDVVASLALVETALARSGRGFPPMSPWWRDTITRFVQSGKRQLVLRVGRRGGKSSTLCRYAVAIALSDTWSVPPGDVGVVAFVSVSRDEAAQRLRNIEAILRAMGVSFERRGDSIELSDRPAVFKVYTCTVSGVVGFTAIAVFGDEVAKWRSGDDHANPAPEVAATLGPTTATQPSAPTVLSSSPLGTTDFHAERFELGETDAQSVGYASTWVANPTLTEEDTRLLEPDERIWSREYLAVPQAGALGAFGADDVGDAFARPADGRPNRRVMVIDASSGRKDAWTWAIVGWNSGEDGSRVLTFDVIDGVSAKQWGSQSGADIVRRAALVAHERGVHRVIGDQRESLMLQSEFTRHALHFTAIDWTSTSKPSAVERVRRLLADGMISLPEHDTLRRELLQFEERITPSGAFTFGARGSGHDDYVSLLVTAAMADERRMLPGSPLGGGREAADAAYVRAMGRRTDPTRERQRSPRQVLQAEVDAAKRSGNYQQVTDDVALVGTAAGVRVVKQRQSPWSRLKESTQRRRTATLRAREAHVLAASRGDGGIITGIR